ncbi:Hypothetical protein Minf_2174 [Methylacidiphilum infernorum V4]|uniref:Uncharacterized protein n=1 Tax=Methylacidiphilum infernorum (isolate V4) TaxID=481448 RepID=B3DZP3_METI4|nr:Hypothetical protein Minf_2174 [Methylacidiphilum infernorum V4]
MDKKRSEDYSLHDKGSIGSMEVLKEKTLQSL